MAYSYSCSCSFCLWGAQAASLLAPAACRRTLFGKAAEKHKQVACAPRNSITPVTYAPLAGKGAAPRDEMPVTPDSLPFSCSSCDADRIPPSFIYGTVCFAHAGQLLYNRD